MLQPIVYRLLGDGALSSKRQGDCDPQHHCHQDRGDGSNETHIGNPRHTASAVYLGQGFRGAKASSVVEGTADATRSEWSNSRSQKSSRSVAIIPSSESSETAVLTYPRTSWCSPRPSIQHHESEVIELIDRKRGIVRTDEIEVSFEERDLQPAFRGASK